MPRHLALPMTAALLAACAPHITLPPPPYTAPGIVAPADSVAALARRLAPMLYVQRDEPFPLVRVAAVVHPDRPIIAYHFLWQHDVNGQWMPWTKPSDEEVAWVGYDPRTGEPTDIWTYWHNTVLHADWHDHGPPAIDVQWGKHGSLPHGVVESDLPPLRTLNAFYAYHFLFLPDILLGRLSRPGPSGFFHSYRRYRDFSRTLVLGDSLSAVVRTEDPHEALATVFGKPYSRKTPWP
jgi:hypothetical protein